MAMGARAIWKGVIRFGDEQLPVKLYSAVEDRNIHFHLLHNQDMVRLKQRLVNAETGKTVEFASAQRGFEVERNQFVVLKDEQLKSLTPEPSRDITITRFVTAELIDPQWYDRPYFLGPDDDELGRYFAMATALTETDMLGVARWVMRDKSYLGALRAEGDYLMLNTMRFAGQVISASDLDPPQGRPLEKREHQLARQLIEALEDDFDPAEYRDEYRQRVMELIEAKSHGRKVKVREYVAKPATRSLAKSLEASLASAK